jgi:hypothetical protein
MPRSAHLMVDDGRLLLLLALNVQLKLTQLLQLLRGTRPFRYNG